MSVLSSCHWSCFLPTSRQSVVAALLVAAIFLHSSLAAAAGGYHVSNYILPPKLRKTGVVFAGVKIPLDKPEVARRVTEQLNFLLMDRRAAMMEWFDRMATHGGLIRKVLAHEKIPADFLYLCALLSDLEPNARTRSGGVGWWGLGSDRINRPAAVRWTSTNDWDDRRDPVLSTRIACTIFQWLRKKKFAADWLMAICAYVDGPERIERIAKKSSGFSYWGMVMPPGSEVIIPRLIALKIIDSDRDFYAVNVPPLPALAYDFLDRLKLKKDLPLHVIARWCGTNPRSIWELNPGVAPTTGVLPKADQRNPSGFPLRVPKGMGNKVKKLLATEGYLAGS